MLGGENNWLGVVRSIFFFFSLPKFKTQVLMKKLYTTLFALIFTISLFAQWEQVGNTIEGDGDFDEMGTSLDINNDGSMIVASASLSQQSTTALGYTKVFNFTNGDWEQVGNNIEESNTNGGDALGLVVSMSGNGQRIVIGNDRHLPNVNGRARMFEFNGATWMQLGNDIVGTDFNELGDDIAISRDGNRFVVSERLYQFGRGRIFIYEYNGSSLQLIGNSISENIPGSSFGYALTIDDDGDTVGAYYYDTIPLFNVYSFQNNNWEQIGNSVTINQGANVSSVKLKINGAGDRLAVSNPFAEVNGIIVGMVQVYELINGDWQQIGSDIVGDAEDDALGMSVDFNQMGDKIAIGVPGGGAGTSTPEGYSRVYELDNGDWVQINDDIYGSFGFYGTRVGLSGNGNRFISASRLGIGKVEVFENMVPCSLTITCPPNITAIADPVTCEITNVALGTPTVSGCPNETITNNAPTVYELGETTVTWTITNSNGDLETCTQTVIVLDETDPDFDLSTLPDDTTVMVNQGEDYILEDFTIDVVATDNCTQGVLPLTIGQSPVAGTELPIGTHEITLTATDDAGNTAIYEFDITVEEILGTTDFTVTNIKIFPNPAVAQVNINGLDNLHVASIKLIDVSGRTVLDVKDSFNNEVTISVKSLTAGLYFVNIQYKGGMLVKQLLVK